MIMPLLRAVITDVDGTLFPFGESPKVSAGNIAALQRAIDSGLHVGLATGRIPGPWRDRIRTQLPRLGASVFANGALVLSENDEIIHENTMPAAAIEAVEAFTRGGTAGDPAAGRICVLATTRWEAAGDAYDSLRYVELSPQGEESWVTRLIRSAGEPEIVLLPSLQPLLDRRVLKFVLCACSSISNLPPCRTSSLADSLLSLSFCCSVIVSRVGLAQRARMVRHATGRLRAPHGAGRNGRIRPGLRASAVRDLAAGMSQGRWSETIA